MTSPPFTRSAPLIPCVLERSALRAPIIAVCLAFAGASDADTIRVPADYSPIQKAISAAKPGDVVLVADGDYSGPGNQALDTLGKAITVRSENGSQRCRIDCEKASGFVLQTGETSKTRIEGFTIFSSGSNLFSGFVLSGADPTIVDCIVQGPYEPGFALVKAAPSISGCVVTGAHALGMDANSSAPVVSGCDFLSGSCGIFLLECLATLEACTVRPDSGAAVVAQGGTLSVVGCELSSKANGGLEVTGVDLSVLKSVISGCASTGLSVEGGFAEVDSCTISGNGAGGDGGGIRLLLTTASLLSTDVLNNDDAGTSAHGGGLSIIQSDAALEGCNIAGNTCGKGYFISGGGVFVDAASTASLTKCQIMDNVCVSEFEEIADGGGIASDGSLTLNSCTFKANRGERGGGVFSAGATMAQDCVFDKNTAFSGGAVFSAADHSSFARCSFVANIAQDGTFLTAARGGAVSIDSARPTFDECMFRENRAQEVYDQGLAPLGGAVYITGNHPYDPPFRRCLFVGNRVASMAGAAAGGAMAVEGPQGANLVNCIFRANEATVDGPNSRGGAVFIGTLATCSINVSTFFGNSAYAGSGSDLFIDDYAYWAFINNSIFVGGARNDQINGYAVLLNCAVNGSFDGDGEHNIDVNFDFADESCELPPGSPCIDAGDNEQGTGGQYDFDGNARLRDDPGVDDTGIGDAPIVDMGAQEFQGTSPGCYPDFNGDGKLDLFDFLGFVNAFNAQKQEANCVDDKAFDLFDFLCFVNAFNQGC